jgi:predicted Zn-dependent protease
VTAGAGVVGGSAAAPAAVAERVLDLVRERAGSAEVEVTVRQGVENLTRFATSFIHQNVAADVSHVLLRIALDGRVASAALDGPTDDETLHRLAGDAIAAARIAPPDPDWPGLTPPTPPGPVTSASSPTGRLGPSAQHWDEATASAIPDERARRVRDFVDAAGGLETAGFCSTTATIASFANSAGQRLTGRATTANLDGVARTPTADGSARLVSVSLADLSGRDVGERAAAKARSASNPTDLEPGRYEVILEPECVANILSFLLVHGFNGRAVEDGRSFVRLGERQFDPAFSLADDVADPAMVGLGFDVEGTPKRRRELVSAGVTSGLLHNRRTARKAGAESTGHAVEGGGTWGALGANLVVSAGTATADELVAGVERGVLVTDFWYTRILDPKTQVVTGLTRNGVWLIEDGRVVRPVTNLRFTQSFIEALVPGAVRGASAERALLFGGWDSVFLVPTLHLASWNFTGGAKG